MLELLAELLNDFVGHGWNYDPATGGYSPLATIVSGLIFVAPFALLLWYIIKSGRTIERHPEQAPDVLVSMLRVGVGLWIIRNTLFPDKEAEK